MAGDKGVSFPVAAMGIVALWLSALLMVDRPFDVLRLGEAGDARQSRLLQPPVEARLWEDPFVALKRYRDKIKDRCRPDRFQVASTGDPACEGGMPQWQGATTVIAVLLPGDDFVGVEEARRRTRYAVLTGLAEEGYLSEDSERMGFLRRRVCDWNAECDTDPVDIPFETLKADAAGTSRRVVVLWIDDAVLGRNWLSRLAGVLAGIPATPMPELRIIGPYTSGRLKDALQGDLASLDELPDRVWRTVGRTTLISPWATAALDSLVGPVDRARAGRLQSLGGGPEPAPGQAGERRLRFVSTIGSDEINVGLLVRELCSRGIAGQRVVLLREWDAVYAKVLSERLADRLKASQPCKSITGSEGPVDVKIYSYLRGVDGVTLDGAAKEARPAPSSGGKDKAEQAKEPPLEWPETRDQRDYVRRLVERMRSGPDGDGSNLRIAAIGLLGSDVHDKLVLAQALRPAFPDGVLFTTDIDARFAHPQVLTYTRNLVVASSLPLEPPFVADDKDGAVRVTPFRDVYQTATFFAARYAVAAERLLDIQDKLKDGHVYEIGRHGPVELGTRGVAEGERDGRRLYGGLSLAVLAVLAWMMLVSRPGPAMKSAGAFHRDVSARRFRLSTAILSSMTAAGLGFGLGVVIELLLPGQVRLSGALMLALVSALLCLGFRYPGIGAPPSSLHRRHRLYRRAWRRRWLMRLVLPVAVVALAVWLRHSHVPDGMPEPFAASDGVSAWPSQLLRTLAIVLFPWCLDFAWNRGIDIGRGIGHTFFDYDSVKPPRWRPPISWARCRFRLRRLGRRIADRANVFLRDPRAYVRSRVRRTRHGFAAASLWFWQPHLSWRCDKRVDGRRLWKAYLLLSRNPLRVRRLVCWLVVTVALVGTVAGIVAGPWPDIPVRGADDRSLFKVTVFVSTIATLVLLVLATNAALLTWRLIAIMRKGRTMYPKAVVERFAVELGPCVTLAPHLYYPIAARIRDRGEPGAAARNSLLDPWIDAHFLARHTAAVSRLIYFPFILLALMIASRSRMFDNWPLSGPVTIALGCYVLWAAGVAVLLNYGAETARRTAIKYLEKDLLWLKGCGPQYQALAEQFPRLIDQVRELREGAFAPFTQQPLVRAILVPLGAGGLQLLETLIMR